MATVAVIILAVIFFHENTVDEFGGKPIVIPEAERIRKANEVCYEECKEDALICTAYLEGFYEKPYFCGARWTIGYGSTIYPEGDRVTRKSAPIDKNYAKECVFAHFDKHVKPFILDYVKRELTHEEMLGIELFIYNVGGERFSGHSVSGEETGTPSEFLKAINQGESALETAKKMTGFRKSGGRRANGLLKRHWVVAGIYTGIITPDEILNLRPEMFYSSKVAFYYDEMKGDFWDYNFRNVKVSQFIRKNVGEKNVRAII